MPFVTTDAQLAAAGVPAGWEWTTIPRRDQYNGVGLTRGNLSMTRIVRRSRVKLEERFIALHEWARHNNALVRTYSWQDPIQGAKIAGVVQVWFAYNQNTAADYATADGVFDPRTPWTLKGREVPAGLLVDPDTGDTLKCGICSIAGWGLREVEEGNLVCTAHAMKCRHRGCETVIAHQFRFCAEHGERIQCASCNASLELGEGIRQYHSVDGPICAACNRRCCRECSRVVDRLYEFETNGLMSVACAACRRELTGNGEGRREQFDKDAGLTATQLLIEDHKLRPVRLCSVEMETADGGANLAPLYQRAGLSTYDRRVEYHQGGDGAFCYVERDSSLGPTGGEVIFDRLQLNKLSEAQNLEKALTITRKEIEEGRVVMDMRCGLHIHVDAHGLGIGHVRNLALIFNYLEDVLYRLSAARYRKHRGMQYAAKIQKGNFEDRSQFGLRFLPTNGHTHALNIGGYWTAVRNNCQCGASLVGEFEKCKCNLGKNTIEFRVFNGTANPKKLHAYIALSQSMIAFAAGMPDLDEQAFPVQEYTHNAPITPEIRSGWVPRLEWLFANLYFSRLERESLAYVIRNCQIGSELSSLELERVLRTEYAPPKELITRKVEHRNLREANPRGSVPRTGAFRMQYDGDIVAAPPIPPFDEPEDEIF